MVVDRDRQLALRLLLADHVLVEKLFDFLGFREVGLLLLLVEPVLGDDVETDVDTLVADEDRRPGDELLDLALALVTKRASQCIIAGSFLRHGFSLAAGGFETSLMVGSRGDFCQP